MYLDDNTRFEAIPFYSNRDFRERMKAIRENGWAMVACQTMQHPPDEWKALEESGEIERPHCYVLVILRKES